MEVFRQQGNWYLCQIDWRKGRVHFETEQMFLDFFYTANEI